ncbi:MAG: nucleotidyltransferase family protein [Anaeromyxobacteraceae bacterium]
MFPFIRDGDVVTIEPIGPRAVRVGDVVAFRHPSRSDLVIHRAVAVVGAGWLMRGDACAGPDGVVAEADILGRIAAVERRGRSVGFGAGSGASWIAALSRGGWLGTGRGLATVPARGVRFLVRRLPGGPVPAPIEAPLPFPDGSRPAPRERLLLALRRGEVDRSPLAGLSHDDWAEVLELADRHGVTPALQRGLRTAGGHVEVPRGIQDRLRETTLAIGARNARSLAHVGRLLRDFHAAGIEVAVLKGADLAERVYDDVSLRPMADVDLLVRRGDLERASALLRSKGYVGGKHVDDSGFQEAIDENLHVEPVQKPGGPLVELHYAIGIPAQVQGVDMDGVWSRMERARVGGADALVLAPEDLLLHLCIHVALHHGFAARLVQISDVPAVVERMGVRIDREILSSRAREWGVERSVALTFALAERLLGPFGAGVGLPGLDAGHEGSDVVARAERLLFQVESRGMGSTNIPDLFAPGPWHGKAALLARRLFPSREEMAFTYRVPANSPRILLLYPRRALDLIRRHGGTIRGIVGRDPAVAGVLSVEQERMDLVRWLEDRPRPP